VLYIKAALPTVYVDKLGFWVRENAMKIEGQCLCGAIIYEAEVDPARAIICNCADCQTLSGAPFRASVPAKAENFHIRQGEPQVYVKIAESGTRRAQGFCGTCGTPIYACAPDNPPVYNLRLGAVKQRAEIPARRQIWCDSALAWAQDIHALPGVPKG
jgi:hypothetical protein